MLTPQSDEHSPVLQPITLRPRFQGSFAGPRREFTAAGLLALLWRRKFLAAALFVVFLALATAAILRLKPKYTSDALLIVDPRQTHITDLRAIQDGPQLADLNFLRSEMQILASDQLATQVVTALNLENDPEFTSQMGFWGRSIEPSLVRLGLSTPPTPPTAAARMAATVSAYQSRFSTFNDARSFIIAASYTAGSPAAAQRILTEHLSRYLDDQKMAKRRMVQKAQVWLDHELDRLHAKLMTDESAVLAYEQGNGLLRAGGETIVSRQLVDLTSQLAEARADLQRKANRVAELTTMAHTTQDGFGADTAALSSMVLQQLRSQESLASQRVSELQAHYGPNYPGLVSTRAALTEVRSSIAKELSRETQSAQADAAIARANTDRLQDAQARLQSQLSRTSDAELASSQLSRDIEADKHLYDDLLTRSKEVSVQLELQEADARLVSAPSLSLRPVSPRYGVLGVIAIAGSALAAAALAILRDIAAGPRFMALSDIELECGLSGLAILPKIPRGRRTARNPLTSGTHLAASVQTLRNSVAFRMQAMSLAPAAEPDLPGERSGAGARLAPVVVFASALPGDGKTLVSAMFASSMSTNEARVLLIDADLRRSGLSRLLKTNEKAGLAELLAGETANFSCISRDADFGIDVLSAGKARDNPDASLALAPVRRLLGELRQIYDVIIVDTPPISAVDDALPFAALADATVVVVRWSATPPKVVRETLDRLHLAGAKVAGAVLNAANPARFRTYDLESYRRSSAYFLEKSPG